MKQDKKNLIIFQVLVAIALVLDSYRLFLEVKAIQSFHDAFKTLNIIFAVLMVGLLIVGFIASRLKNTQLLSVFAISYLISAGCNFLVVNKFNASKIANHQEYTARKRGGGKGNGTNDNKGPEVETTTKEPITTTETVTSSEPVTVPIEPTESPLPQDGLVPLYPIPSEPNPIDFPTRNRIEVNLESLSQSYTEHGFQFGMALALFYLAKSLHSHFQK